jgi:hypothetical protein
MNAFEDALDERIANDIDLSAADLPDWSVDPLGHQTNPLTSPLRWVYLASWEVVNPFAGYRSLATQLKKTYAG